MAGAGPGWGARAQARCRPGLQGSIPTIWEDLIQPHRVGCGRQRWDEDRRMNRQTHREKKKKQVDPGEDHLSLSPGRRSPDLQARSTSFSKSVCKTEAGWGEGLRASKRGWAAACTALPLGWRDTVSRRCTSKGRVRAHVRARR